MKIYYFTWYISIIMIIVFAILVVLIIVWLLKLSSARTKAATLNPKKTETLYENNPTLSDELIELSYGNKDSLKVLEQLGNLGHKYNEIINNLIFLNIKGYKISYTHRALGKDIMKMSLVCSDMSKLNTINTYVESVKNKVLVASTSINTILDKYEFEDIDELFDSKNIAAYHEALNWDILFNYLPINDELEQALHNFLLPDDINCAQWFINFLSLSDWTHHLDFQGNLDPQTEYLCENPIPAYPIWFKAGYPHIVMWINKSSPEKVLSKKLLNRLETEISDFELGIDTLSQSTLRLIHNEYANTRNR